MLNETFQQELSKVALTGSYNDLNNKPTPTLIINYANSKTDDYTEAIQLFYTGGAVYLRKDNIRIPMIGHDESYCFFGGIIDKNPSDDHINVVYAHIDQNGENYYWHEYEIATSAAGIHSEDAGNYFTSTNVMGQL